MAYWHQYYQQQTTLGKAIELTRLGIKEIDGTIVSERYHILYNQHTANGRGGQWSCETDYNKHYLVKGEKEPWKKGGRTLNYEGYGFLNFPDYDGPCVCINYKLWEEQYNTYGDNGKFLHLSLFDEQNLIEFDFKWIDCQGVHKYQQQDGEIVMVFPYQKKIWNPGTDIVL